MSLTPVILFMALFVNPLEGTWKYNFIKEKTSVVEVCNRTTVEIVEFECNISTDEDVYWELHGGITKGRKLKVEGIGNADGGNYTCHLMNGDIVDYRVILLRNVCIPRNQEESDLDIQCEAKNCSGQFNCFWAAPKMKITKYFAEADRSGSPINCNAPVSNSSHIVVSCQDLETCAYGEEDSNIDFTVHEIYQNNYEKHSTSFMLRDITKPDPPQELHSLDGSLKWKYPNTWCNFHSFFPLIFNVHVKSKGWSEHHNDIKSTKLKLSKKGKFSFCVQARDMFYNSSWSDWTCSK
ncbi:interleukin-12 subunit beta [Pelobates fuscus]|uniref:interleukin-12 subunit beta n=1 Tax=Pelobates fuscus TaxID=191477 RepID=UPI002FE4F124